MQQSIWKANFSYDATAIDWEKTKKDIFHPSLRKVIGGGVPVSYISVTGGADRKLELAQTDDMTLVSELEQAKFCKNIRLFMSPESAFSGSDIMQIALTGMVVDAQIHFSRFTSEKNTKGLIFNVKLGYIKEPPRKLDSALTKKNYLFVNLGFVEAELEYYSPKGKEIVVEKW